VLSSVKENRNVLHKIKIKMVNWIGHIFRRNCLIKHVTEGKIQGTMELIEDEEEVVSSY
jgi:hypothetical protein